MYDTILVATDGDLESTAAVDHAVDLAAAHDATLHALYVVDSEVYTAYGGDEFVDEREGLEHALEERGNDALDEVVERGETAGVSVEAVLERGSPGETIVDYADEVDADLVVVGSRGYGGANRDHVGSVAERVVRRSGRPVTVVKTPVGT